MKLQLTTRAAILLFGGVSLLTACGEGGGINRPTINPPGSGVAVPTVTSPSVALPTVTLPTVTLPTVTLPTVTLPTATKPTSEKDWVKTGPHLMVVGSNEVLAGYPTGAKPDTSAPYVIWAGTPYAHLMVPIGK